MPAPIPLTLPGVEDYADAHTTPDSADLLEIARYTTDEVDRPHMMVGPVEARFLQFLLIALRPARVLEIGTYTGYSALSMAQVLPAESHITTCELNEDFAAVAAKHFAASPYADRITLEVGPALDTIARQSGRFDFILLDADQPHFDQYLRPLTQLLSDNGILAADNTLWSGSVLDEDDHRAGADGIRRFNSAVAADPDLVSVLLTVRDGLMLVRHK
jgi:caffeoyl-CoA O-methyltransferase